MGRPRRIYTRTELEVLYNEYHHDPAFAALRRGYGGLVRGIGSIRPKVMFIGEAPGAEEERLGRPFVGPSGKLLDSLLEGVGLSRDEVWITNLVKYRPPNNRDPWPDEIEYSTPYLEREVEILRPRIVAFLGRHALNALFPAMQISRVHGQPWRDNKRWYLPLYHPAVGLYNPTTRKTLRTDFARIPELLEGPGG